MENSATHSTLSKTDTHILIIDYSPQWHEAFRSLNVEWIEKYFTMEADDYKVLDHPEEEIIQPGGCILMAVAGDEAVGTCALIKEDADTFELAKMGVAPHLRGKGIGWMLSLAALDKARQLGAKKVVLGSNSSLVPALKMYVKLGFRHITGRPSPYQRADVQMEYAFSEE